MKRGTEKILKYINKKKTYVYETMLSCSGDNLEGKHILMMTQEELDAALSESPAFQAFFTKAKAIMEERGETPPPLPEPFEPDWDGAMLGFLREIGMVPKAPKSHRHRQSRPLTKRKCKH